MNLVSVIIPVYNVLPYLNRCVQSVLMQSYKNIEVILVDDGSTDGSSEFCDNLAKQDHRIKVVHKINGGLSSARNAGIKNASGDYCFFVDSDDYISTNTISVMVKNAKLKNADLVVCGYNDVYKNKSNRKHVLPQNVYNYDEFWKVFFQSNDKTIYILPWNKLYKRKLFETCKFSEGKIHEDEFIIETITSLCKKISFINQALYNYVHRDTSITNTKVSVRNLDAVEAFQERIDSFEIKNKNLYALHTLYMVPGITSRIVSQIPSSQNGEMMKRLNKIKKTYVKQCIVLIKRGILTWHLFLQFIAFMIGPNFYNKVMRRK